MNEELKKQVIESKGDIFKIFIFIYDSMCEKLIENNDIHFYKRICENIKTSEDSNIFGKFVKEKPMKVKDYYEYIDISNLNVKSVEDFEIIEKILFTVTTKAIVMRFKYETKEKARKEYLKQLEYLKYGMLKKEGKKC